MSKRLDGKKQLEQMLNQPLPVSNTPRTDAETWRDEMDHVDTDYTFAQSVTVSADFARQLERELAEAKETIKMLETRHGAIMLCHQVQMDEITKQRNHYKAACDQYSEDEMLCKLQEVTKQRDILAEALEHMLTHGETHQPPLRDTISNIAFQALAATKGESHATLQ
jgi:hypothetical protein